MKQKFKDYRADFYALSGKASDISRQLAFAGIAVVWIFKQQGNSVVSVPEGLLVPALLFVIALALDLLQYVVASITWGRFLILAERTDPEDDKVLEASSYANVPANILFMFKIASVLLGYFLVIRYFLEILKPVG